MNLGEFQILLIDDDKDDFVHIRDLMSESLRAKYHLTWKPSYEEGLRALGSGTFDACLLDYRLGEHTGLEVLQETLKLESVCPIIFLTGQGDFDLDLQAMQIGASDYLVKDQLSSPLIERAIRYAIKHACDKEELKENRSQLLQKDRLASLGLLASSLAHEIGTPLGTIRSRAQLVEKKAETESVKESMGIIISQIDRISKLVYSLLNLAREKQSDFSGTISVKSVFDDVIDLVNCELDRKKIELKFEMTGDPIVKAEAGPLGQVLLNLLINSVHAIEEGRKSAKLRGKSGEELLGDPVEVKKEIKEDQILVRVEDREDGIEITIKDTGCGIAKMNMPQLFKPFFTTKDVGQGTGLGLATSFKIVQSWGGSLRAESEMGKGAMFIINLHKGAKESTARK